ncbi:MAG: adenylate kinase [Nanohaloarchaea archaeon]|nr:adenylate kinase [Candidatus Nanohaloarchaea archaeon]
MGEVNIIIGLSGVGKGTVLEQAMLITDEDYKVINYGDRMVEIAKDQRLVDSRDDLKKLDTETNKQLQKDAAESIFDDAEDNDVIVETHAAIQTPFGYLPGLPKWTLENLEPSKIIMLRAEPKAIYERTLEDDSRDREHEEVEQIEEYQEVAREMASTGAVLTGAYLSVIENPDGHAEQAAEDLIEVLRG